MSFKAFVGLLILMAVLGACTGPAGLTGAQGELGPQGERGEVGAQGPSGLAGKAGAQGPSGPAGKAGAQGPEGLHGPIGPQGPPGEHGEQGPQGDRGADGTDGLRGPSGEQGERGPTGAPGSSGARGPQGPAGPKGVGGTGFIVWDSPPTIDHSGVLTFEMENMSNADMARNFLAMFDRAGVYLGFIGEQWETTAELHASEWVVNGRSLRVAADATSLTSRLSFICVNNAGRFVLRGSGDVADHDHSIVLGCHRVQLEDS